ncbi:MAG: NAD-binding protein [Phycisphaerales bacterium]|nr:NAD-binding protein [Phycisphaerales bacterium]
MRVLIADKFESEGIEGLKALGCKVRSEPEAGPDTLPDLLADFDPEVLIVRSTKVPAPVINAGGSLKLIIRAGAGYDNIDTNAAADRGVAVCNCPGMNAAAVAELTIGLLIACDRRIGDQTAQTRAGRWNKKEFSAARGLKGRTLAIVGVGAIGQEVIQRAKAFDMKVVVWSRRMSVERADELGVASGGSTRKDLLKLASEADAVSVHVASTDDTKNLIDAEFLRSMKPGAIFINTSRGTVVDQDALCKVASERSLRVGLDVYADQPADKACDWTSTAAKIPWAVFTHHCGASTDQAQLAVAEETVRIVSEFMKNGSTPNLVNEPRAAAAR